MADPGTPAPLPSVPPVLLRRPYRWSRRWLAGLGRRAGTIFLLLPFAAILALFLSIFLAHELCLRITDPDTCARSFTVAHRAGLLTVATMLLLCGWTLVARLLFRLQRPRERARADGARESLRQRLGSYPPTKGRYAELHDQWRQARTSYHDHNRILVFLAGLTILLAGVAFASFLIGSDRFDEYGRLFPSGFDDGIVNYYLLQVVVALATWAALTAFHLLRPLQRVVRHERDTFHRELDAEAARLIRALEQGTPAEAAPGYTFRPWSGAPTPTPPATKNSVPTETPPNP